MSCGARSLRPGCKPALLMRFIAVSVPSFGIGPFSEASLLARARLDLEAGPRDPNSPHHTPTDQPASATDGNAQNGAKLARTRHSAPRQLGAERSMCRGTA